MQKKSRDSHSFVIKIVQNKCILSIFCKYIGLLLWFLLLLLLICFRCCNVIIFRTKLYICRYDIVIIYYLLQFLNVIQNLVNKDLLSWNVLFLVHFNFFEKMHYYSHFDICLCVCVLPNRWNAFQFFMQMAPQHALCCP